MAESGWRNFGEGNLRDNLEYLYRPIDQSISASKVSFNSCSIPGMLPARGPDPSGALGPGGEAGRLAVMLSDMRVSWNGGIPKLMVYNGKSY